MNNRSQEQIRQWFKAQAHLLDIPEAYYGDEPNTNGKERNDSFDGHTWLQCACYPYPQSMGNHSVPLIYQHINDNPGWACDRAWSLNSHKEDKVFTRAGIPMFGIGSKRAMGAFDVVGFSVNFNLLFQNVVRMLQISDIEPSRVKRESMDEPFPLIIVGANVAGQPMAVTSVFDVVWLGELEDEVLEDGTPNPGIHHFLDLTSRWIDGGDWYTATGREAYLRDVAKNCPWIFIPRFYKTTYHKINDRWRVKTVEPTVEEAPKVIKKRFVHDLDAIPALTKPPLTFHDAESFGIGDIEVSRSCSAKCTFSLSGNTQILLADGTEVSIQELVRTQYAGQVKGYVDGQLVNADVFGWHETLCDQDHWLTLEFRGATLHNGRHLNITTDHEVLTTEGWRNASKLTIGDEVVVAVPIMEAQRACLIGSILGDATAKQGKRLYAMSTAREFEYLKSKADLFGSSTYEIKPSPSSYTGQWGNGWAFEFTHQAAYAVMAQLYQGRAGGKASRVIDLAWLKRYVDDAALAIWIQDDGSRLTDRIECRISLGRMSNYNIGTISEFFLWKGYRFHFDMGKNSVSSIVFTADTSRAIWAKIAPFVHPCMRYKLPPEFQNRAERHQQDDMAVYIGTTKVVRVRSSSFRHTHFDITTSTGNFVANGHVVHNCGAMYRQAPFRVRSEEYLVKAFKEAKRNTGAMGMAPLTLEWGTHPRKKAITKRILEEVTDQWGAPALRVDNIAEDPGFTQLMRASGKDFVTLGVEGCSQRLRTSVTKGIDTMAILKAVDNSIKAGMERIKIYMISDLPGETLEDTMEAVQLAAELDRLRRAYAREKVQIRFSFTPFTCQGNTPLQWAKIDLEKRSLGELYPHLKSLGMDFTLGKKGRRGNRYYSQILEIGDRVAGEALLEVAERIGVFYFGAIPTEAHVWLTEALAKRGRTWADYFDEKPHDTIFEWDILDILVSKEYMLRLYQQQMTFLESKKEYDESRSRAVIQRGYLRSGSKCIDRCDGCGACSIDVLKKIISFRSINDDAIRLSDIKIIDETSYVQKLRIAAWLPPDRRFVRIGHWRTQLRRAFYLNDIRIAKRSIKSSSDALKHRSWISGVEYFEIGIQQRIGSSEIEDLKQKMNDKLVYMQILDIQPFNKQIDTLRASRTLNLYRVETDVPVNFLAKELEVYSAKPDATVKLRKEEHQRGVVVIDVPWADAVKFAWVESDGPHTFLWLVIWGTTSPYEVLAAIHSARSGFALRYPAVRLDTLILPDAGESDWFVESCKGCGTRFYSNLMGYNVEFCPRCRVKGIKQEHPFERLLTAAGEMAADIEMEEGETAEEIAVAMGAI